MRDEKPLAEEAAAEACAHVALSELLDSRYHGFYPPKTRLYLFLKIKTENGRKPVRLTGAMVADLGLDGQGKGRYLRQLEAAGVVRVQRDQLLSPLVEWCDRLADTGPSR
jgi:hypothetical protein